MALIFNRSIAKYFKLSLKGALKFVEKSFYITFSRIEKALVQTDINLYYAPIFIVGNPRSGSTLLYQAIALYYEVCYFSNLIGLFPKCPIIMARFTSLINGCTPTDRLENRFGQTKGWSAPNQGEYIWKRWLNDLYDFNTCMMECDQKKFHIMRNTIGHLQKYYNAPSLHKWQPLCERIKDLAQIFPEALFVRIKRKKEFIAQSILHSRRKLWNDCNRWFSTKPKNYEEIVKHNYLLQICEQIDGIENDIDRDLDIIGKDKCLPIHYEELCDSPHIVMDKISYFYRNKIKLEIRLRTAKRLPAKFECRNMIKIDQSEFNFFENYFHSCEK